MLTLNDIINVSFRKSGFSGYRAEDVDNFIDRVRESYDALQKKGIEQDEKIESLNGEAKQSAEKLKVLADKIEEYRSQEDEIKNALISAQKLGDASVREARHKAEIILKDANLKAERVVASADEKVEEQRKQLEDLRKEVSDFRSKLLAAYKEHLTLINALPVSKPETPQAPPVKEPEPAAEEAGPDEAVQETQADEDSGAFRAQISYFDDSEAQNE